jgi:hypothetical protein
MHMKLLPIVAVISAAAVSAWAEPLPLAPSAWDIRYSDGPAHPSASSEAGWEINLIHGGDTGPDPAMQLSGHRVRHHELE